MKLLTYIHLAISNDAFELWFLLHYEYYSSETHRSNLQKHLTKKMGKKYNKNDLELYNKLKSSQHQAIKYASKLWNDHEQNIGSYINETDKLIHKHNINPYTTVYQLVEKLINIVNKQGGN